MNKTYVIAHSHHIYQHWLSLHKLDPLQHKFISVYNHEAFRGIRGITVKSLAPVVPMRTMQLLLTQEIEVEYV